MLHLTLRTVKYIRNEFEKNLYKYSTETYNINEFEKVVILEDSLALYIGIQKEDFCVCENVKEKYGWTKDCEFMDMPEKGKDYYILFIEELTYNNLGFKYNHRGFIRDMESFTGINYLGLDVTYTKFKGYSRAYWCQEEKTFVEKINELVPEAKLKERYKSWEGIKYNFIVLEIEDVNGNIEYGVAYTTQNPHTYINSRCKKILKQGAYNSLGDIRQGNLKFEKAFELWKGKTRKYRLENHFRYFYLSKYFREKDNVWRYADKILERAYKDEYTHKEKSTYLKPINKWISEELVYNLTKKLYKDYNVIYQHRPFFLKGPTGGQMSYDVFISGLNIAIEYQGKQHFEAVEFFGGEEGYRKTVERDKLKKQLSDKYGIKLVYINYWEEINLKLIDEKISNRKCN
ncbi:hypothetical protein [Romboutsia lituseburensis]|uniref:hypothetical protein n=1 Tax=Romboutsia lituseburensis TaxID=1537 RepID=UPI00215A5D0C|nr:hypothetical protein [Romboutsia lituseburensis]MCR8744269.1 hypothetical protein [Romboutsia lituseburensis]